MNLTDNNNEKDHVDFNVIHLYTERDEDFEKIFIALAIDSIKDALENITREIQNENLVNIRACGHKLKGASSIAGLIQLNKFAYVLNEMGSIDPIHIKSILEEIKEEVRIITQILQAYLDKL
ncbi:MAG: Hpt domain-containing protein [Ginsengibacter sp.]|jgi:HPt (histidine-containing phosphotransfer) domain-containing protein